MTAIDADLTSTKWQAFAARDEAAVLEEEARVAREAAREAKALLLQVYL